MKQAPEYVDLVRSIIPKNGLSLSGTKPNRVKAKVKKSLTRAGYGVETIRGVGLKLGEYAVVYDITDEMIKASFQEFASLPVKAKAKRRSSGRAKVQPILTGPHPDVVGMTGREFAYAIFNALPKEWEEASFTSYRWISTDISFLYNTGHTVVDAATYITQIAANLLANQPRIYRSLIEVDDKFLIGVGPA